MAENLIHTLEEIFRLPIKTRQAEIVYDEDKIYSDEGYIPDWEWMDNFVKKLPYADKI